MPTAPITTPAIHGRAPMLPPDAGGAEVLGALLVVEACVASGRDDVVEVGGGGGELEVVEAAGLGVTFREHVWIILRSITALLLTSCRG